MVLPEVQTILGRAAANRYRLLDLLEVLDDDHWGRRESGAAWDVHDHLQHLATIEPLILSSVDEAVRNGWAWLCGAETLDALERARESARASHGEKRPQALVELAERGRQRLAESISELVVDDLDAVIRFPPPTEWDQPPAVALRAYLQAWAAHDSDHEQAIRRAVTTPPGPADLASAARMGRG